MEKLNDSTPTHLFLCIEAWPFWDVISRENEIFREAQDVPQKLLPSTLSHLIEQSER